MKYQTALTIGVAGSMFIDFKEGKNVRQEVVKKVELADDTEEGAVPKASV